MSTNKVRLNLLKVSNSSFVTYLSNCSYLDVQYYPPSNPLKRNLSIADQRGSPLKKRQYPQEVALPVATGLFDKFSQISIKSIRLCRRR